MGPKGGEEDPGVLVTDVDVDSVPGVGQWSCIAVGSLCSTPRWNFCFSLKLLSGSLLSLCINGGGNSVFQNQILFQSSVFVLCQVKDKGEDASFTNYPSSYKDTTNFFGHLLYQTCASVGPSLCLHPDFLYPLLFKVIPMVLSWYPYFHSSTSGVLW